VGGGAYPLMGTYRPGINWLYLMPRLRNFREWARLGASLTLDYCCIVVNGAGN